MRSRNGAARPSHSPCPRRARPPAPAAPAPAASGGRAGSAPSGGAWWAPAQSPGVSRTRSLSSHRVPCVARVGEPGCEVRLASRPGAGFVGLSRPVRPSPLRRLTVAPREGRSGSGPALVPPPLQLTRQCPSNLGVVPGRRARAARLRGKWAGIQGTGLRRRCSQGPGAEAEQGVRVGGRELCGCAMGRRLSGVEGVASGRAQIKWEARGAAALGSPAGSGSRRCHLAASLLSSPPAEDAAEARLDRGAAEPGGVRRAGWR